MPDKPDFATTIEALAGARPSRALVLQGGGALGAYQAGVYESLSNAGFRPDWVAGISIGAVNAAIIAGNARENRLKALQAFWERVSTALPLSLPLADAGIRSIASQSNAAMIAAFGVPGFFLPRFAPPLLVGMGSPADVSFYDTRPLKATLESLIDFDRINAGELRLSLGAVDVATGALAYFDNRSGTKFRAEHVMASGALPPGFPPIQIDGAWYWDGGLLSNTPLEYVLGNACESDLQVFQVDLFNGIGRVPTTIVEAAAREKEIRYASRTLHNTQTEMRAHAVKSALKNVMQHLPEAARETADAKLLAGFAQDHRVKIVQLIYRSKPFEGSSKDFEFSRGAMLEHWRAGKRDADRAMRHPEKLECRLACEVIDPALEIA